LVSPLQKVQEFKENLLTLPTTPFIAHQKGMSKMELERIDKMTKEEQNELPADIFKLYTLQSSLMKNSLIEINEKTLAPFLPSEVAAKSKIPNSYEMTTIISYMIHADGTDEEVSNSPEICEMVEHHFIFYINKIIEKIVNQNTVKKVSRNELAAVLIPHRNLIRLIEYEFALIDHIKSQKGSKQNYMGYSVDNSLEEIDDEMDEDIIIDDHAKFGDDNDTSEDENPFAGICMGLAAMHSKSYKNPNRWHAECLQGDPNDSYFEQIDQIKHDRKLFRGNFSRDMDADQLKYFHACSTKRTGSPKKFLLWLKKKTSYETANFEFDSLALDGISYLLDFRLHALVKDTLEKVQGTPSYSLSDIYKKSLCDVIATYEKNDATDF
jgi:hypothetical protein